MTPECAKPTAPNPLFKLIKTFSFSLNLNELAKKNTNLRNYPVLEKPTSKIQIKFSYCMSSSSYFEALHRKRVIACQLSCRSMFGVRRAVKLRGSGAMLVVCPRC